MFDVRRALVAGAILISTTAALARPITLRTADRVNLSADHYGTGTDAVVLVHANGGDRSGWGSLAEDLSDQGVQVVNVDLRGHGASTGDADPLQSIEDVHAAVKYARSKGAKRITIVGAKLGGNLAFATAAKDPEVYAVVMISPALNANGVKVTSALKGFGERKLVMVVGNDDNLGKKAANLIANELDNSQVEVLESGGTGMALVNRASDLTSLLVATAADNKAAAGQTEQTLKTGEGVNGEIETTGTKLGEK